MAFNKITIVGNLGKDPVLRYTPQGDAVCDFSVATSEKRGGEEITTWFKVTVWKKQAEAVSKYLSKGKPVYVDGRLRLEEYQDRDGQKRTQLAVSATDVQFIGSRSSDEGERASAASAASKQANIPADDRYSKDDDDIPF